MNVIQAFKRIYYSYPRSLLMCQDISCNTIHCGPNGDTSIQCTVTITNTNFQRNPSRKKKTWKCCKFSITKSDLHLVTHRSYQLFLPKNSTHNGLNRMKATKQVCKSPFSPQSGFKWIILAVEFYDNWPTIHYLSNFAVEPGDTKFGTILKPTAFTRAYT